MKKVSQWIVVVLRLGLAGLFLWAGLAKLRDPQAFAEAITAFRFFPVPIVHLLAAIVPIVEIAAGILILTPRWQRQGTLLCAVLSLVFASLLGKALYSGWDIHCGCFGKEAGINGSPFLGFLRAFGMALASVALYGWELSWFGQRGIQDG